MVTSHCYPVQRIDRFMNFYRHLAFLFSPSSNSIDFNFLKNKVIKPKIEEKGNNIYIYIRKPEKKITAQNFLEGCVAVIDKRDLPPEHKKDLPQSRDFLLERNSESEN